MSKPGRTWKDQNKRRRKLGKKHPRKAIAEHKLREARRLARKDTELAHEQPAGKVHVV